LYALDNALFDLFPETLHPTKRKDQLYSSSIDLGGLLAVAIFFGNFSFPIIHLIVIFLHLDFLCILFDELLSLPLSNFSLFFLIRFIFDLYVFFEAIRLLCFKIFTGLFTMKLRLSCIHLILRKLARSTSTFNFLSCYLTYVELYLINSYINYYFAQSIALLMGSVFLTLIILGFALVRLSHFFPTYLLIGGAALYISALIATQWLFKNEIETHEKSLSFIRSCETRRLELPNSQFWRCKFKGLKPLQLYVGSGLSNLFYIKRSTVMTFFEVGAIYTINAILGVPGIK